MGLISWLKGDDLQSIEKRHTDTEPSAYPIDWQLDSVIWHTHHGPISAEAVPAVYAALDLIGSSVAQLETLEETPLLRKPDPFSSRFEFFFETVWSLAWHGDAYWLLTPTERGIDSMQVLPSADVGVDWDDTLRRRLRTYTWLGKEVPSERIRHLRFHPRPGELRGLSPIEAARVTWEGSAASEIWGSQLFVDGVPSGVLTAPTLLTEPESSALKKQWDDARKGKRDTAVLSGGMKYEPVELTPEELQWIEGRASVAQEVARAFHIPSDMLEVAIQGGASSITYRNLAEIGADFVQWCLKPYLAIVEQAWGSLQGQPSVSFDTTPLYEESLETRARTLQLLVTSGADPQAAAEECGFDFQVTEKEVPVGTPAI
jgi:HK97 family phage portal protein